MPKLAIRQDVKDGLSSEDWDLLKALPTQLQLGIGPLKTDGVNNWHVFDDSRFTIEDAARFASVFGNLDGILEGEKQAFLAAVRWSVPADAGDQEDPWAYTFEQNGAPDSILMGSDLPQLYEIPEE